MTLDIPTGEFKGYIFDCDGTLADTMPLHYQAWLVAVHEQGGDFPEDLFYALGGMTSVAIIALLNQRFRVLDARGGKRRCARSSCSKR